jgi:hypothetical protein
MLNKLYHTVMSLINKTKNESPSVKEGDLSLKKNDFSLEKQEIEFMLTLIKNSTFKGENLELLFNLTYKLQQQYLNK